MSYGENTVNHNQNKQRENDMNIMKESAILTAGITGFNLPDGCSVNDLPGNTIEDKILDIKSSVFDDVISAIEKVSQDLIINNLDDLTMESEEQLKREILDLIYDNVKDQLCI